MVSDRDIEDRAVDSPSPYARKHVEQYLATDGAEVEHPSADRMILLYTKGRKTGNIRRIPVVHFPDGDDMLIVASKGGAPRHPEWYLNLAADPHVWVRYRDEFFGALASTLTHEERTQAWRAITDRSPAFAEYQGRVSRVIPVVRLIRR